MIVKCPECSTRYLVDPNSLGPGGRRVRCARCGAVWTQQPPDDAPLPVAFDTDVYEHTPFDMGIPEPDDFEPALEPPARPARRRKDNTAMARWIVLLVAVGMLSVGLVAGRNQVVALWPPAALLYHTLDIPVSLPGEGLELQNVRSQQKVQDGASVLVVEGEVVNTSDRPRNVTPLRATSLGANGQPVQSWLILVEPNRLEPGQRTIFQGIQRDPGPVVEVNLTFDHG